MATLNTTWMSTFSNADVTLFKAWAQSLSTALQAVGLVKTSDTGQIDWATVTVPVGVNTSRGFEIYRLNDSLQSTYPIFFRFDFGTGNVVGAAGLRIQVGTGTNGAGVLSGVMFDSYVIPYTTTASTNLELDSGPIVTSLLNFASGDGEFVAVLLNPQSYTVNPVMFFFERSRDASGTPTGEGIFVGVAAGQGSGPLLWCRTTVAAYGSSSKYMVMNMTTQGLVGMIPVSVSGQAGFPNTPVSTDFNYPVFYRMTATIPGGRTWLVRHFLQPPTHADASLAPSFRADPDGKGAKLFRLILLGTIRAGFFGFGNTTNTIPIAFTWAD